MPDIGQPERATQKRIIALFRDELRYRCLGDWSDEPDNSNIEEDLLTAYLTKSGYSPAQISRALLSVSAPVLEKSLVPIPHARSPGVGRRTPSQSSLMPCTAG